MAEKQINLYSTKFIHTSAARHPHLLVAALIFKVRESRRLVIEVGL
jgi:hypothetical protein